MAPLTDIASPDQQNKKLWFWHYPYNEPNNDTATEIMQEAYDKLTVGISTADLSSKYPNTTNYTNAVFDAVDWQKVQQVNGSDLEAQWLWVWVGKRAKIFHPQVPFHTHIKDVVLAQYKKDTEDKAPKADQNACHSISGNYWVMHRDTAVNNVNDICAQGSKSVEYNQGTVNHLCLSVDYPANESQGPDNALDCKGHYINAVLDGCDGNDPINNPHNYKFGSTLTLSAGWVFKIEALSWQVVADSCDVSYKFIYHGFEVRGKDWPDSKPGAHGKGLQTQPRRCGALTDCGFEWTPHDVKYHWYAHGHLPVGTKACVGRAVESAGGSSVGNGARSGSRK
ncbi:MAG: hypothetical protein LQ347_001191 [Umbilicaria vellea]|nr:MAG: hypothetical protein LQ347_001191 [Umbilicaria vellea]